MEKPSTIYSNSSESFLPGICKELIGSSIDFLGQSFDEEKTIADSLINNLLRLHNGVIAISKAHEEQDEESQDNRKPFLCFFPSPTMTALYPSLLTWCIRPASLHHASMLQWQLYVSSPIGDRFLQ